MDKNCNCNCNFSCNQSCQEMSCDKYKEKADQLLVRVKYLKREEERLVAEAKKFEEESLKLEKRAQQLCHQAKMALHEAGNVHQEYFKLLEMSNCYLQKMNDCYQASDNPICYDLECNMGCYKPVCDDDWLY